MKRLIGLIAVIALLNLGAGAALADDPQVSVTPDVRPGTGSSTAGASTTASGGSAGPATVTSSEPVTASTSSTGVPGGGSSGSTTASGPGTSANVPLNATAAEPEPTPPNGAPETTTTGPTADADASETSVWTSDSGAHARMNSTATGAFGAFANGIGSAEDPTNASTCTSADATPGTPTDASLGTMCGSEPTTVGEDASASTADGNGASGTPSASSCLGANASAGTAPSGEIFAACPASGNPPSTASDPAGTNAGGTSVPGSNGLGSNGFGSTGLGSTSSDTGNGATALLGLTWLPSTSTAVASASGVGALLAVAGFMLLVYLRRGLGTSWEPVEN